MLYVTKTVIIETDQLSLKILEAWTEVVDCDLSLHLGNLPFLHLIRRISIISPTHKTILCVYHWLKKKRSALLRTPTFLVG